jgi:hypothetical protein
VNSNLKESSLSLSSSRVSDPNYVFMGSVRMRAMNISRRLSGLPVVRAWQERKYQAQLSGYSAQLPVLDAADDAVAKGLATSHIASRQVQLEAAVDNAARRAVEWLEANSSAHAVTYLPLSLMSDDPALFSWGLTEQNLDIAERYIGLPVRYLGMEAKVEHARPAAAFNSVRNWHVDVEDRRMIKVIVYLSDVDEEAGPFEYIPAAASDAVRSKMRWRPGFTFLRDVELAEVVPHADWTRVTGPARTVVYADTSRLIHRVREPQVHARYSVTYVYTSQQPFHSLSRFMPPQQVLRSLLPTLTPRQRRALAGA